MTEATRLILVRHGQTASNGADANPRLSGWADFPLSSLGWQQARALLERFQVEPGVSGVYASPLQRARATAQTLHQESWGPIQWMEDLREINCGKVDGLPIAEVKQHFGKWWVENLRQENPDFRWPGG